MLGGGSPRVAVLARRLITIMLSTAPGRSHTTCAFLPQRTNAYRHNGVRACAAQYFPAVGGEEARGVCALKVLQRGRH